MELEELHVLGDDMGSCTILLIAPKLIVDLDNIGQFVGQVVLRQKSALSPTVQLPCTCQHTASLTPAPHHHPGRQLWALGPQIQKHLDGL